MFALAPGVCVADSSDDRAAEARIWAFAFGLSSGITVQEHRGAISPDAQVASFQPGTKEPAPLRMPVEGSFLAVTPNFGVNVEVMSPELGWAPLRPRVFANAEFLPSFASDGAVALEGAASGFKLPDKTAEQPTTYPQEAIAGKGSRATAALGTYVYAAHMGLAFPTEIRGRLVRIKPSLGWINFAVNMNGRVLDAFKDDPVPVPTTPPRYGANIRFLTLENAASQRFNAIGPGLELEMDVRKFYGLRPSIYASGHAYHVVGETTFGAEDRLSVDDALGEATYAATWAVTVDDWMYRAALGIRLRWVGRD